jgi:hypothetical protein
MTRSILAALAASFAVSVLSGTGCASTGVGDPCTPEQEYRPDFLGFSVNEVSVESKSFQCQTRLCLVNHFQGRVSCPYGQTKDGTNIDPAVPCANISKVPNAGCCTPGISQAVTGRLNNGVPADPTNKEQVLGQCTLRKADTAVYCSCRCQNINGATNDGANYCTCPDGFSCQQLVTSIGSGDQGLTGAYCVKNNTQYDPAVGCGATCDPKTHTCGSAQGVAQ